MHSLLAPAPLDQSIWTSLKEDYDMNEKEAYEKKQHAKLAEWEAEIDKLKAKAEQADADARIKIEEDLKQAEAIKDNVAARLDEVKGSADDAWRDLKTGIDAAATNLTSALRSATSRFS